MRKPLTSTEKKIKNVWSYLMNCEDSCRNEKEYKRANKAFEDFRDLANEVKTFEELKNLIKYMNL